MTKHRKICIFAALYANLMQRKPFQQFFKSELVRNSGKLLSANVIAQIVGLLVYPFLARIYTQTDFGVFNLFMSIAGILLTISTAQYQFAIPLCKEEKDSVAVFHVGLFTLVITVAVSCIFLPFSKQIAGLFKTPELARFLWLIPIYVLCCGIWQITNYWYTRLKHFRAISGYQVSQSVLSAAGKLGLGYVPYSGGLIYGGVIAPFLSATSNYIVHRHIMTPLFQFDKKRCKVVARQYRNLPLFSLPRNLVYSLSNSLPVLMLVAAFGLQQVGIWGMAVTLAFTPITVICNSLYQVFFQKISERVNNRQSIASILRRYWIYAVAITALLFVPLYFFLPALTSWLLGGVWEMTGYYIRWMLPWLLLVVLTSPHSYLSDVFFKQKIEFVYEVILIALRFATLYIGIHYNNFILAIAGYCMVSFIVRAGILCWYILIVREYEKSIEE